jgi:hypothetical protein
VRSAGTNGGEQLLSALGSCPCPPHARAVTLRGFSPEGSGVCPQCVMVHARCFEPKGPQHNAIQEYKLRPLHQNLQPTANTDHAANDRRPIARATIR